jgi:hypothetical protein
VVVRDPGRDSAAAGHEYRQYRCEVQGGEAARELAPQREGRVDEEEDDDDREHGQERNEHG